MERIIGGAWTGADEFPYAVALTWNGIVFCGGTLYASQYVVTAAHCFYSVNSNPWYLLPFVEVRIGCSAYSDCPWTNIRRIWTLMPHPGFNSATFENDILVIQLTAPVNVAIAPLITSEQANMETPSATVAEYSLPSF